MLSSKLRILLKLRSMTPAQLARAANASRPTMSRIMRGHVPAAETLTRIAEVLKISPGYLRGGYQLPSHLTEEDILTLADMRCVTYLRLVREMAVRGVTSADFRKLIEIINRHPKQD